MGFPVLILQKAIQTVFKKQHQFLCPGRIILCQPVYIRQRHKEPSFCPEPYPGAAAGYRIRPVRLTAYIASMQVQPCLFVPQQAVGALKLVHDIIPPVLTVFRQAFCVKMHSHVKAVQPHLVGVNVLMPEVAGGCPGIMFKKSICLLNPAAIPPIPGQVPEDPQGFAKTDLINIIFILFPVGNPAVLIHQPLTGIKDVTVPARVAGNIRLEGCTGYTEVILIIPGPFTEETGKYRFHVL